MGAAEKLRQRAAIHGRTAAVDCGELGQMTVEALPLRDVQLLYRGADGARNVFYAACRELQQIGQTLFREKQLYAPDGIMEFVSDEEAAAAARAILELSGWSDQNNVYRDLSVVRDSGEIRHLSVQEKKEDFSEIRPVSVQETEMAFQEIRHLSVQKTEDASPADGRNSREFLPQDANFMAEKKPSFKAQGMGSFIAERTQNVVMQEDKVPFVEQYEEKGEFPVHEIKSDFGQVMHETESESREMLPRRMHEIKSEFQEIPSRYLHETKSDFRKPMHETESEFGENPPMRVHETESEQAERLAKALLSGLCRAKWVRGG